MADSIGPTEVSQQSRYDADEMIRFSKTLAEEEGFQLMAEWLKRMANAQKQISELQTTLVSSTSLSSLADWETSCYDPFRASVGQGQWLFGDA